MTDNKLKSLAERIERYSMPEPNSGCHLWLGAFDGAGYGHIKVNGRMMRAHRVSWEVVNGPFPLGLVARHKCDVRGCVNPAHITPGTQSQNLVDALDRGHLRSRLGAEQVIAIRSDPRPTSVVARQYGIGERAIREIKQRRTFRHIGEQP